MKCERIRGSAEAKFAGTQSTVAPPQHRLYFLPEPQGHGSFRPTLEVLLRGCALSGQRGQQRPVLFRPGV